jgi:hypothetical protein
MNMEIKLLKEKQQQSEGNSLWGVINRSSQPLINNIVDSNQKYQNMKKQVDTDLNVLYSLSRKRSMRISDWLTSRMQFCARWLSCRREWRRCMR